MASLQEQLLKAGLANKQSANQIRSEKRKKNKAVRKNQAAQDTTLQDELNKKKAEQAEIDAKKNQVIKKALDEKSEQGKVKQMVLQLHIKDYAGEVEYNYVLEGKVKRLLLDDVTHNAVVKGRVSICYVDGVVYLLMDHEYYSDVAGFKVTEQIDPTNGGVGNAIDFLSQSLGIPYLSIENSYCGLEFHLE